MLETFERLLRLLALLQARREWNGPQLAQELAVKPRTVRKDIERLRAMGYPINAAPGIAGGYQLGSGTSLPPLLLDDEEALAVAVGLTIAAAGGAVTGIDETAQRALRKLEQMLPAHVYRRLAGLHDATVAIGRDTASVSAGVLATIAAAIRDRQRMRFDYQAWDRRATLRTVKPHRLVHPRGRWYLVAWDRKRDAWRTFRFDRISPRAHTGPSFTRRPDPDGDIVGHVQRGLGGAVWGHSARVTVYAPAAEIVTRVPPEVIIDPISDQTCLAHAGSDSAHALAQWLTHLDADFEVQDDPELATELRSLARRLQRAAREVPAGAGAS